MTMQIAGTAQGAPAIARAQPIQGVDGSVAAFLGVARQGPYVSVAVQSLVQFEAYFGEGASAEGWPAPNYLWHAVKGFFDNGGGTVHVTRLRTVDRDGIEVDERALAQALDALQGDQEAALLCAPGVRLVQGHERLCQMLLRHCEAQRWRFALLDTPSGLAPVQACALRERLRSGHGALYYPWIAVRSAVSSNANDDTVLVPPSGHLAGLYADSDDQPGTHKAPANLPLSGALTLERPIGDGEYGALAPLAINCLRSQPGGRNVWVWGARTLSDDSESSFVAVRRYMLYLQKSIEHGLQWVHLQPTGERLWDEIAQAVSDFLYREWRSGALMGSSAQDAFFVRCERSSLPRADLEAGRSVVQIGVALVEPGQFVHLRLALQAQT
jgi:phage tail sheath protein FI